MTFSPCLPLHLHHGSVWPAPACVKTGSDQEKTFGPTIAKLIYDNVEPERRILYDSKKEGGRPDAMKLVRDAYHSWGAEGMSIHSDIQRERQCVDLAILV